MCSDCIVHTGVGFKCASCTGSQPEAASSTLQRLVGWRPSAVTTAVTVGAVIVLGAAAFAVFRPGPMGTSGDRADGVTTSGDTDAGEQHAEHDVSFEGDGDVTLQGTLTVPAGAEGHVPAVVIVPGFGPTDRDGIVGAPGDPLYRDLAEALAEHGVAVLRYDKRGAGQSDRVDEDDTLTFDDRVSDAAAAVAHVRDRPEVDGGRVGMIGHDEGGFATLRVAGEDANLDGLALIGTPGRPFVKLVVEAYRDTDDEEHEEIADELEEAVDELLATGELPEIDEDLDMGIAQILPEGQDEYLYGLFSVEPTADAGDVTSPVLIVHGEQDPNINHDTDVQPLREALVNAAAVDVLTRPDAGHTLRFGEDEGHGDEMGGSAGQSGRDEEALVEIAEWFTQRFAR